MPSIFDLLLGRNQAAAGTPPFNPNAPTGQPVQPSMLDAYSTRGADTLMGLSQGLLAAGGPSPYPVDMLGAIGKGVQGALASREAGEDKGLRRALTASQVQKASADIANEKAWRDMFKGPNAATATASAPPTAAPVSGAPGGDVLGRSGDATASLESGGRYDAIGPVANAKGNRAYGKYQVLDSNIPVWTQQVLGKPMTPQEFLANPQAQDAVYKAKMGEYIQKHGSPEAASRAWFAGEGGMNNPNAKDVNGTTVQGYGNRFAQSYGPGANSPQVASGLSPASLPGVAASPAGVSPSGQTFAGMPATAPPGIAQGDNIPGAPPRGDGSGNPVQPVQYSPQAGPGPAPQGAPKTLPEVIQSLPPAVRQMMGAMPRKDALPLLMKYADPETHVAIDSTTGQVVFAPKNDNSGRYQPVDAAKLDMDRQRLEVEKRQAAARETTAATGAINAPVNPTTGQPNAVVPQALGGIEAAKEKAKQETAFAYDAAKTLTKERVQEYETKLRPQAMAAASEITSIHSARQLLDAGAITGTGATARNNFEQLKATLGIPTEQAANGPALMGALAERTLSSIKTLGANPSNADRDYIEKAKGGSVEFSEPALRRILDIGERISRQSLKTHDTEAGRIQNMRGVKEAMGPDYFQITQPQTYEEWKAANPLPAAKAPGALSPIDAEIERRKGLKK